MTAQSILERLRKDRVAQIASSLLANAPLDGDPEILYRIARASRNKKIAAFQAVRVASKFPERSDAAQEWYWLAFLAGAELPKQNLYRIVNFSLRTARHKRTRLILNAIRKRFGYSFRLASSWLDFYLRTSEFKLAEKLASKTAERAQKRERPNYAGYFQARQAGFLIRINDYDKAEKILHNLKENQALRDNKNVQGLIYHYLGLASFNKGKFDSAIEYTSRAISFHYSERPAALMNLGIVFGRLRRLHDATNWFTNPYEFRKDG